MSKEQRILILSNESTSFLIDNSMLANKKTFRRALYSFIAQSFSLGEEFGFYKRLSLIRLPMKRLNVGTAILLKNKYTVFSFKHHFRFYPFVVFDNEDFIDNMLCDILKFFKFSNWSFRHVVDDSFASCFIVVNKQEDIYIE